MGQFPSDGTTFTSASLKDKDDAQLTVFYIFAGQAAQFDDPKQFSINPWRTG